MQATHAPRGEKGRLTAVTQVSHNTCVTVWKGGEWRSKRSGLSAPSVGSAKQS